MTYAIKEIFYTLQGEGARAGRPAVFLRFAGCNLWNGREEDRASAVCRFCDTDFVGITGPTGMLSSSAKRVADKVEAAWPEGNRQRRYVVCTGGEPLLQLDAPLLAALHGRGFEIAVETNGTIAAPAGIDWICVSPKAGAGWVQRVGHELKLVYPQGRNPEEYEHGDFDHFYLQPMDGLARVKNLRACVEYCLANPRWSLSTQTHKAIGIP